MSDAVLSAVLGRVPARQDALIMGYERCRILGRCYPAIRLVSDFPTSVVKGQLLMDCSGQELATLDEFEDPAYSRVTLKVRLRDGSELHARAYVRSSDSVSDLLDEDWSWDNFLTQDLSSYVERCREWAKLRGKSPSK